MVFLPSCWAVTFPAVSSRGDSTQIQAPLLSDRCTESSSGIAGEKPGIALSADGRILSAVERAGLFYRLKLFFRIIKILHVFLLS